MARPLRIEFPGAFYHVTARGVWDHAFAVSKAIARLGAQLSAGTLTGRSADPAESR